MLEPVWIEAFWKGFMIHFLIRLKRECTPFSESLKLVTALIHGNKEDFMRGLTIRKLRAWGLI